MPSPRAAPAHLSPLNIKKSRGELLPFDPAPKLIHAFGLTYAGHIQETGMHGEQPELFEKHPRSLFGAKDAIAMPSRRQLLEAIEEAEARLGDRIDRRFTRLPPMLDYEVELGMVLLRDASADELRRPDCVPPVGYFVANDLTARCVQVLGESPGARMRLWSAAKSFRSFLGVGPLVWVPADAPPDGCPDVSLTTRVNGQLRQQGRPLDLVCSPQRLLALAAERTATGRLEKGDLVLTGTPAGVAFQVSAWKRRLVAPLPRLSKLSVALWANRSNDRLLKIGDEVEISGGPLGRLTVMVVESTP